MKTSSYVVLTGWAIELLEQYGVDDSVSLTLFCHIHALTTNEGTRGGYDGTLNTLAYWTRSKTKHRVMRSLEKLVETGLVLKETELQNNIMRCKYRSNLAIINSFLYTAPDRVQNKHTMSKIDTGYVQNEHGGMSKIDTGYVQNEHAPVFKMNTHKRKVETKAEKKEEKEREKKKEPAPATDGSSLPLFEKALEPAPATRPDFEIPTQEQVEHALRNIICRPPDDEIELCAGYFIDRMEREDWKTRDWRNALRRYAQRWNVRGQASGNRPPKQQPPPTPAEWTPDSEPTRFNVWAIELGGTLEQNEENLQRYMEEEVLPWERKHKKRVSWRQSEGWKEELFAPLYRRLEKERKDR